MTEGALAPSRPGRASPDAWASCCRRRFSSRSPSVAVGLTRNPQEIPSALIGKPVPAFALPPVQGRTLGLSNADLKGESRS